MRVLHVLAQVVPLALLLSSEAALAGGAWKYWGMPCIRSQAKEEIGSKNPEVLTPYLLQELLNDLPGGRAEPNEVNQTALERVFQDADLHETAYLWATANWTAQNNAQAHIAFRFLSTLADARKTIGFDPDSPTVSLYYLRTILRLTGRRDHGLKIDVDYQLMAKVNQFFDDRSGLKPGVTEELFTLLKHEVIPRAHSIGMAASFVD